MKAIGPACKITRYTCTRCLGTGSISYDGVKINCYACSKHKGYMIKKEIMCLYCCGDGKDNSGNVCSHCNGNGYIDSEDD